MDSKLTKISVKSLPDNVFKLLEDDWMLITAGNREKFNTMTASWGTLGILWNKPIAIAFIRPQRYTFELIDKSEYFTLSFYEEKHRSTLNFLGSHSGRNMDKVSQSNLTPVHSEHGIYFKEARLVLSCRKMYSDDVKNDHFFYPNLVKEIYPKNDFHRFFVGEIVDCLSINAPFKGVADDLSGETEVAL